MSDVNLPEGWGYTNVGSYLYLKNGFAFKSGNYVNPSKVTYPVIRISDLNGFIATDKNAAHVEYGAEGFEIRRGDLLIAMSGATTGKIGIYEGSEPAYQNQRVGNLKLHFEALGCERYKNRLISALSDQILKIAYGGAQPNISGKAIEEIEISLPPLAEQKVIADKLDTLLAQVETTKARLERIPNILKTFRQSVLAAAVSGKLTEEWRGNKSLNINKPSMSIGSNNNEAPSGWSWEKLTDLAHLESGHTPRKSVIEYWENGDVQWLSLQDIRKAHGRIIEDTKFKPTMLGIENSSARLLPKGTVCFCRDISVGYVTIMGTSMSTTQHFANWVCGEKLNNKFLMYSFMAAKDYLLISGQGTTVKTIYMPALKELRILIPSENEQTEIVRRVEELFAFADNIEQKANAALERVNNLTQSILAKAFRGELTADWRIANPELITGENSADALLAKIKAEREAMKKQTKKKTQVKKAKA